MQNTYAPGAPGIKPVWTSGAKSGIGKALSASSDVAFAIDNGILNEVYYPREDIACIRNMQFLVTDGQDFFADEEKGTHHSIKTIQQGIPYYIINNTGREKRFQIKKDILCDPYRNTILQRIIFKQPSGSKLRLYALINPHIGNKGRGNTAFIEEHKGIPMMFAESKNLALAVTCSCSWLNLSAGFVGISDGWKDVQENRKITQQYTRAENGNVALIGEIDLSANSSFTLAIGFGGNVNEAASHARASLLDGFDTPKKPYIHLWKQWLNNLSNVRGKLYKESAAVLKMQEAKTFPGGIIASFSIPWGEVKSDEEQGGYHVVWPRDLVESAGGFLALKAYEDALRTLNYLMAMQQADGSWPQNMWLEGIPHWKGIQMDQTALPLLLFDRCESYRIIDKERMKRYWPAIRKAISYIIRNGPYTQQDRWEEEKGYTPFTLATEIAGLLAAADIADKNGEPGLAEYCRETADYWNDNIDYWLYATGTSLADKYKVDGYYIRINPHNTAAANLTNEYIHLQNHTGEEGKTALTDLVCVDALALVRFGLRPADDPKILNTIKVIDALLKVETPRGKCWHRYNNDGYGEHENGGPYDGSGIGRAWPLLTGERAHYEIAAGNFEEAKALMNAMEAFSNNALLPEQIWDTDDIPEKNLYCGRPSGSAMPLTWAHAEYLKLCCSLKNKKVFDMPAQTSERYLKKKNVSSPLKVWRFNYRCKTIPQEKILRIEVFAEAVVHWSADGWTTVNETNTKDTGIGLFIADITPNTGSTSMEFTFFWSASQKWENENFSVEIEKKPS